MEVTAPRQTETAGVPPGTSEVIAGSLPLPGLSVILASRSPRRLELLSLLVPRERIHVLPPSSAEEAGFEGLTTRPKIEARLRSIAAIKCDDVLRQLASSPDSAIVVAADTVIVAQDRSDAKSSKEPAFVVLGQPPEATWRETTLRWFLDHYAGRTHFALTALCVAGPMFRHESIVETRVTFRPDVAESIDWYLDTGEPCGKAGGYAIQGLGSLFVERIEGSLTNVIGLPLRELVDALKAADQSLRGESKTT